MKIMSLIFNKCWFLLAHIKAVFFKLRNRFPTMRYMYCFSNPKVGVLRGGEIIINIGQFRYFIAGKYQIDRCHVAEQ